MDVNSRLRKYGVEPQEMNSKLYVSLRNVIEDIKGESYIDGYNNAIDAAKNAASTDNLLKLKK